VLIAVLSNTVCGACETLDRSRRTLEDTPSAKKKWTLSADAFDGLLAWLDPDRELAGEKYERIRVGLIRGFQKHGCVLPEELADETINRVARRLPDIVETYVGEPVRYFYGVAHHVHMEYLRKPKAVSLTQTSLLLKDLPVPSYPPDDVEPEYECLKHCMEHLTPENREMILQYYQGERDIKIKLRKELAERLGMKLANLRLRAQRVRNMLKDCILHCLEQKVPG
jgi:DNA-directed RNA polymerase specialized sigma24 family protein